MKGFVGADGKTFLSKAEERRYVASLLKTEIIWVRHTGKEGDVFVNEHSVWDRDLFMQSLARGAAQAGGEAKVELITQAQYEKERNKAARRRK